MDTQRQRALPWQLWVTAVILLLSLLPTGPSAAQGSATACASGYALWANGRTRPETLLISGSDSVISGAVRSNADLRLSGSRLQISGAAEYVTRFDDEGDANSYPAPARVAASEPPLSYAIADYRPGGAAAAAAAAAGRYRVISGDLDIGEPQVLDGLYYVTGNAKLGASDLRGSFTIVAEGMIDVSGSKQNVSPYADGLLLFANKREVGASTLKIAGGDSTLRGVIYAPGGTAELSGSANSVNGAIVADALKLSGSNLRVSFNAAYCPGQPEPQPEPGAAYTQGEVVLKLFSAGDLGAVAAQYGLDPAPIDQFGSRPIYRLRVVGSADPLAKAGELKGDGRVEYAEPNYLTETPESRRGRGSWVVGGDDGDYRGQWAPDTIRLAEAHTVTRGAGVTVAVLDTGLDLAHPAFAGRLVPGFDFVDFDADPSEVGAQTSEGAFGHGTHVAGLVALAAPDAKIMPVRVLDEAGVGNIWVLSEALLFAAETGPDGRLVSGDEAEVINLSLGTLRETRLLADLVAEVTCANDDDDDDNGRCATTGGAVVIAAAGNGGDSTRQYPAAEGVAGSLAIAASDQNDELADFSTFGPWVQLAAPGEAILSTVPGGAYGTWSGTSMAAPLTAGVAALVRAAEPGLAAVAVADRLVERASPLCGPVALRLDAAVALGKAQQPPAGCSTSGEYLLYLAMLARR